MRALALTLAIVTSPIGAAVCEVVCTDHAVAGPEAAPANGAVAEGHHHHHAAEAPPVDTAGAATFRNRVEDCSPPLGLPAAIRSATTRGAAAPAAHLGALSPHSTIEVHGHAGGPPVWSSPPPPLLSTIPLRI